MDWSELAQRVDKFMSLKTKALLEVRLQVSILLGMVVGLMFGVANINFTLLNIIIFIVFIVGVVIVNQLFFRRIDRKVTEQYGGADEDTTDETKIPCM
jgi:uncharacterized membrane protein YoaK (UPF0700 family)